MRRSLASLGFVACLALAAAGCGSGSASGSSSTAPTLSGSTDGTTSPSQAGSGQGVSTTTEGSQGMVSGSESAGGIRSIIEYGSAAGGAEKAAASAAAHSFFAALADREYAKICAALSAGNRQQLHGYLKLEQFQGIGCAGVVKKLLASPQITAAARKAAHGTVSAVRVKGGTAFVLFKPVAGPRSFFVMKRERGAWKATALAPGLPLNPTAP